MDTPRPCGCKGIRTCLICENEYGIKKDFRIYDDINRYMYCPWCNKAWPGWDETIYQEHPHHRGTSIDFPGVYIQLNFLTAEEEESILKGIDEMPWDLSQSGRRKQNFGPKCNFKKQRLKIGDFHGFPLFTKFVQEKFQQVSVLQGYKTIEQCSLEYDPARGASIDPHIDDCWIWGERIVTVNLLSDCILTMTPYCGDPGRYNLKCTSTYPRILSNSGVVIYEPFLSDRTSKNLNAKCIDTPESITEAGKTEEIDVWPVVRIPMPRRSLLVLYGKARYDWEHSVLRKDVHERRVCLAYREFTPPYIEQGELSSISSEILKEAKNFWDHKC